MHLVVVATASLDYDVAVRCRLGPYPLNLLLYNGNIYTSQPYVSRSSVAFAQARLSFGSGLLRPAQACSPYAHAY
jgi:hypothetical protein